MDVKFLSILQKNPTFSILHTYFYKTPTSVCLFYTLFYLNNILLTFFYYFTATHGPTNFNTHANSNNISYLYLSFFFFFSFFFLLFSFFFSFSFFLLLHFFFFSIFFFLLLLLMLKQEVKERKLLVGKLFFFLEKMVGKLKNNRNLMFWSGYIEEAMMKYSEALSCY